MSRVDDPYELVDAVNPRVAAEVIADRAVSAAFDYGSWGIVDLVLLRTPETLKPLVLEAIFGKIEWSPDTPKN